MMSWSLNPSESQPDVRQRNLVYQSLPEQMILMIHPKGHQESMKECHKFTGILGKSVNLDWIPYFTLSGMKCEPTLEGKR